jgi:hypothetical protein
VEERIRGTRKRSREGQVTGGGRDEGLRERVSEGQDRVKMGKESGWKERRV